MEQWVLYIIAISVIISFIIWSFLKKTDDDPYKEDDLLEDKVPKKLKEGEIVHLTPRDIFEEEKRNIDIPEIHNKVDFNPNYKNHWFALKKILDDNNINSLYHITDFRNVESINLHNHLFSWHFAERKKIIINNPGGNQLSRDLDSRYGVQNYVRLCFTTDLPMIHKALRDGRIKHPVVFEFDPKIIFFKDTKFCQINATDNNAIIGDTIEIFQNIRFDIIKKKGFVEDNNLRKFKQAEVLVLEKLSLDYLKKKPYQWR